MKKKVFIMATIFTCVISMSVGAYGASKLQEIKAYLNPTITVKVDGVPVQLKDVNGMDIVPITYNGSTYVPARAIANAVNYAVDFDASTNTVLLGERIEGIAISQKFDDMYHTKDSQFTVYNGKDYKQVYFNNGSGNREAGFMLKPEKQYQTLSLQIAAIDKPIKNLTIKDSENNIILKTVELINPEDKLVTIEANIGGVSSLYIYASAERDGKVLIPLTTSYFK